MRLVALALLIATSTALADRPAPKKRAPVAIVLVIERSAMMAGRFDAVKEMVNVVAETLEPDDMLGVVAFDSGATTVIRLQRWYERKRIATEISRLTTGGSTLYLPALVEAAKLLDGVKMRKHVIFVSGGFSTSDGLDERATEMRANNITITAVGMQGVERTVLSRISEAGEGRLYMVEDVAALPRIGIKEVREVTTKPPPKPVPRKRP